MCENTEEDHKFEVTKMLIETSRDSSKFFDKAILTITSGAFGLSLIFLKDIVPNPDKKSLYILMFGWILFAISFIVIVISFLTSQEACNFEIRRTYLPNDRLNIWSIVTRTFNFLSVICLILAIVFMGDFFYTNLSSNSGGSMEKNPKKINERYVPPSPQKGYVPITLPQQKPQKPQTPTKPESPKPKK